MSNLPFKHYSSIKNVQSKEGITTIEIFSNVPAVALEKAHGAHFSFQTDGKIVECARRRDVLGDGHSFYNFQKLLEEYSDSIKNIFTLMDSNTTSIQVDGELIGGLYDHPDVEKAHNSTPVQKEVYYCPDNKFFAYDILCFKDNGDRIFVNYDKAIEIFSSVGFLYAEPLARGTFSELCKMSNVFQSLIPKQLGLPLIENNMAEGLVIKPVNDLRSQKGSRVILKSKNKKFSETDDEVRKQKFKKPIGGLSSEIIDCLDSMVTMNRLNNVISKIGEVTDNDFGMLMKDLNLDILEEFKEEHENIYNSLDKKTFPLAKKYLNGKCSTLIRQYFI